MRVDVTRSRDDLLQSTTSTARRTSNTIGSNIARRVDERRGTGGPLRVIVVTGQSVVGVIRGKVVAVPLKCMDVMVVSDVGRGI